MCVENTLILDNKYSKLFPNFEIWRLNIRHVNASVRVHTTLRYSDAVKELIPVCHIINSLVAIFVKALRVLPHNPPHLLEPHSSCALRQQGGAWGASQLQKVSLTEPLAKRRCTPLIGSLAAQKPDTVMANIFIVNQRGCFLVTPLQNDWNLLFQCK